MAQAMGRDAGRGASSSSARRTGGTSSITKTGFVRARRTDGSFREPFDPAAAGYGSRLHRRQCLAVLVVRAAGHRRADPRCSAASDSSSRSSTPSSTRRSIRRSSRTSRTSRGLIGYYAHGNEPSHHIAYLYDYAGEPWKTQARLTADHGHQYTPAPDGLAGNDDCGQMSAWLRLHRARLLPGGAGQQRVRDRPAVREHADAHLPNGKTFTVEAANLDDGHPYVGSVTLNGKPLTRVLPAAGRDRGRRRAPLRDAGAAEPHVGDGEGEPAVFDDGILTDACRR